MPDWPPAPFTLFQGGTIHAGSRQSLVGDLIAAGALVFSTAAAWPAANRALYVPFMVERTVTAYQMAFEVGAQAGNCDVGIYDVLGNRLVSKGSTAVGAAGIQVIDITDTVLTPAVYYMAMNVDTITTLTITRVAANAAGIQMCGMQQEALGGVALQATATFANPAASYVPSITVVLRSTI